MTLATLVNRLKAEGTIVPVRVNRYQIGDTQRARNLGVSVGSVVNLQRVHELFCRETAPGSNDWVFRLPIPRPRPEATAPPQETRVLRTIVRQSYHSNGGGTGRSDIERYLLQIPRDEDGVRRSYGMEYEIYALTPTQEDKLARLLDTLPHHITERDASLSSTGVEIVFYPMSKEKVIETFNRLSRFVTENGVRMEGTGSHITYGVSNSTCTESDLQIRINRIALAVKSVGTQAAIKSLFGRDFTGYAALPTNTTTRGHSNAWSASRGSSAYELRLCNWQGNIEKMVEFMNATEFVFTRTFRAEDFMEIFRIMGSTSEGV